MAQIIVPRYAGSGRQPGPARSFDVAARGAAGRRPWLVQLFSAYPTWCTYVDVAGTNPDIDTTQDLASLSRAGG